LSFAPAANLGDALLAALIVKAADFATLRTKKWLDGLLGEVRREVQRSRIQPPLPPDFQDTMGPGVLLTANQFLARVSLLLGSGSAVLKPH